MNTWGNKIKLSIFGESHGEALGITIDGFPAGLELDFDYIDRFIERRKTAKSKFTSSRKEKDKYEILSGLKDKVTTGAPLCVIFRNENVKSKDYKNLEDVLRPSHADYPAKIKFSSFNDMRGGGHFSGRITLALTFAGAIAKYYLEKKDIKIYSHIKKILNLVDESFLEKKLEENRFKELENKSLAFLNSELEKKAKELVEKISEVGDSVGGEIECVAFNIPVGLGSPFFNSLESQISHLAFSVPAVKGIEFGAGFDIVNKLGSLANDTYYYENNNKKEIKTRTNNNGGILGGLSNGMPLVFSVAIKPTPSISLEQESVNIKTQENEKLKISGRHDACIVPRVLPVIESVMALSILNEIL